MRQEPFVFGNITAEILHTIRVKPKFGYNAHLMQEYLNKMKIQSCDRLEVYTPADSSEAVYTRNITFKVSSNGSLPEAIASILLAVDSLDIETSDALYQKDLLDMVES